MEAEQTSWCATSCDGSELLTLRTVYASSHLLAMDWMTDGRSVQQRVVGSESVRKNLMTFRLAFSLRMSPRIRLVVTVELFIQCLVEPSESVNSIKSKRSVD